MALKGIKVLDFCRFQNGPHATAQLADLGATLCCRVQAKVRIPFIGSQTWVSAVSGRANPAASSGSLPGISGRLPGISGKLP